MKADELFEKVTEQLIAEIESGAAEWRMPWQRLADAGTPESVDGRAYRGFNALWLPMVAADQGWSTGVWATYQGWQRHGAQVRRGEKSTTVALWKQAKPRDTDKEDPDDTETRRHRWFARGYNVFAAEQVDGAAELVEQRTTRRQGDAPDRIAAAEAYFEAIGASVVVGGNRACYVPSLDQIKVPPLAQFDDAEHFYSTQAHEHVHWTGHPSRLARDLTGRFGSDAYAAEELVAELGAALWCAQTGIASATRLDHAAYLSGWLNILRADPRHLLTVTSKAQSAIDWLNTRAGTVARPIPADVGGSRCTKARHEPAVS